MWSAELNERLNDKGISSQYSLVEWKFYTTIDARFPFLQEVIEDVKVKIARS